MANPQYKSTGCLVTLLIMLLITVSLGCTKQPKVEPSFEKPQTISITINDNTSPQILVK